MSTDDASDETLAKKAAEHPAHFKWVASVHPIDPCAPRHHNVLLFDFVLKRSLCFKGQRFAGEVFETAPFFARPA